MAKLLCINNITYRAGLNRIGDIVGIFPDTQPFTEKEKVQFTIVDVPGTREEYAASLPSIETKQAILVTAKVGEFQEVISADTKTLWKDGVDWRVLEKQPKYALNYDGTESKLVVPTLAENVKKPVILSEKPVIQPIQDTII